MVCCKIFLHEELLLSLYVTYFSSSLIVESKINKNKYEKKEKNVYNVVYLEKKKKRGILINHLTARRNFPTMYREHSEFYPYYSIK